MDREEFREQITQRYIAGKAMDGASLDEIARGMVDPVEQMNYVTSQSERKSSSSAGSESTGSTILGWFILIALLALALLSGAAKLLL